MKLNFDAMRELLLVIEEQPRNIDVNKVVFDERLKKFDKNELGYALEKLIEARLLKGEVHKTKMESLIKIDSISVEGHQFIDSIRQDTIWNKTKEMATSIGTTSIKNLSILALEVMKSWAKGYLNP